MDPAESGLTTEITLKYVAVATACTYALILLINKIRKESLDTKRRKKRQR